MNRRDLLKSLTMAGAASTLAPGSAVAMPPQARARAGSFRFLYFTDTHIQPELDAGTGCRMCFAQMVHEPVQFAVCGGDLVSCHRH